MTLKPMMPDHASTPGNIVPFDADNSAGKPKPDILAGSDLGVLRTAIADAATVTSGFWISFLFTFFYLSIAASSEDHVDLFLQNPVKLPFLNVEVPLSTFFALGPILFFAAHANLLLCIVFLSSKTRAFNHVLRTMDFSTSEESMARDQLPSNIFVQFLAGPSQFRSGWLGGVLGLTSISTLVLAPLALLLYFQIQFLPYHAEPTLWLQRCMVILDAALLWALWPHIWPSNDTRSGFAAAHIVSKNFVLASGIGAAAFSTTVATFPYEFMETYVPQLTFIPTKISYNNAVRGVKAWKIELHSLHDLLFGGSVDTRTGRPRSLWSNRLILPQLDAKLGVGSTNGAAIVPFSFRGRRLEGAILYSANLRELDFSGADLQGAYLIYADLRGAHMHCVATAFDPDENDPSPANVKEVCTRLEGATLDGAHMEDADLDGAQLQGASLNGARLQGATLDNADLEGADVEGANLDATSMEKTDLRAAQLRSARIRGATLRWTQLQGASLQDAEISSSLFDEVYFWRTNLTGASVKSNLVIAPVSGLWGGCPAAPERACDFGQQEYAALIHLVKSALPDTGNKAGNRDLNRQHALDRISGSLNPTAPATVKDPQAADWVVLFHGTTSDLEFHKAQAAQWHKTACALDDEPYPLNGVEERLGEEHDGGAPLAHPQLGLIRSLLEGAGCPEMNDLAANRKQRLEQLLSGSR